MFSRFVPHNLGMKVVAVCKVISKSRIQSSHIIHNAVASYNLKNGMHLQGNVSRIATVPELLEGAICRRALDLKNKARKQSVFL